MNKLSLTILVLLISSLFPFERVEAQIQGINCANPPAGIIFCDDFESGNLNKWNDEEWDGPNSSFFSITSDPKRVRSGSRALEGLITATKGSTSLVKYLTPGLDEAWLQFDVMFEEGFKNQRTDGLGMHLTSFAAFADLGKRGVAGTKPNGKDFFVVIIDPEGPGGNDRYSGYTGPMVLYAYWPDMPCGSPCYGNHLYQSAPKIPAPIGVWQRVLVHVKANTPGQKDGFERIYIDGVLKISLENIRLRDVATLKLNIFSILNYMPDSPQIQHTWWDNVIISSSPITPQASTLQGDLNNDRIVNSLDFSILNSKWFKSDPTADINKDGIVNSLDFSILNKNWFKTV